MNAERTQDVPDVVSHRLDAQVQLSGDPFRGTSLLEQSENLCLAWCELRMRRARLETVDVRHLTEDADQLVSLEQRHSAHLDADALAVGVHQDDLRVM